MNQNQTNTLHNISDTLIDWWRIKGRKFPWRNVSDPYKILIAELMLHRTRAPQVELAYNQLMNKYPTINDLFSARSEILRDILHPLGLNWRIDSILQVLVELKENFRGIVPDEKDKLLSFKGVGDYIASAVACFAFGHPEAVIDTNTSRVVSRLIGFRGHGELRRKRQVRESFKSIIDKERPQEFNYALIDLGALICTPRNPKCETCPIRESCITGRMR